MSTRADVVGFSRGVTSAVTAWLVAQEHPETTILLFHDPKEEDPDNERFGREVAEFIGLPITEFSDGRTVSEVFEDEGMLGNNRMTPCSRILKQQLGDAFTRQLQQQGRSVTRYFGYAQGEERRWDRMVQVGAVAGFAVRCPLIERGMTKRDCKDLVTGCWGIRLPRSYDHYDNANCKGCVKGGLAYWGQVYLFDRETWELRADQEDEFQNTILNSRYGAYPEGTLRKMLPRCLEEAEKWRKAREQRGAQGSLFALIDAPCACGS